MPKFFTKIVLFSFIISLTAFAQETTGSQTKPTAAVLDFTGTGISQMEAVTLTQRLASELVKTDALIIVERSQMSEIMDEQGLQQSGCTSAECAAEIGALLGVQKMITGSFGKIGNTYTIDARMFSVETGETEKTVNKNYKGEVDGLLAQIEIVAWELVGLQPPDALLAAAGLKTPEQEQVEIKEEPKKKKGGFGKFVRRVTMLGILAGGGYYAYTQLGNQSSDLPLPPDPPATHKVLVNGGGAR